MLSEPKLRALIVSPTPTWPLNYGNRKRIFSVCSKLKSLGFEIHFIHYASEGDWRNSIPTSSRNKMQQQWDFVDHIWPSKPLHEWPVDGEDHKIDEWWDWALENHLAKTLAAREYDMLVVNYTWLSKALELAPKNTLKILDTHDKFSGRRQLLAKQGIGKEFFHTTESQEVIALNRADIVWAIKKEEQHEFVKMGSKAQVRTLLHVDTLRESSSPDIENGAIFGFIGANNNINLVNINRFIQVATPIFRKFCAPLKFKIAGSICSELEVTENPFFEKIGYVTSIDDFYDSIHAAVIPMEFSTGLKIKVAEALSQSKPIIAHSHATEGFSKKHTYHSIEDFTKLAEAIVNSAYDHSVFKSLKSASIDSHNEAEDLVWEELIRVKDLIISKKNIVVILPESYGDKSTITHFLAQAKIDLLNWNFTNVTYISLSKREEEISHFPFVRLIAESKLIEYLEFINPKIILNLCEQFNPEQKIDNIKVISICPLRNTITNQTIYSSYSEISDENYFPSIGHIHIEKKEFSKKCNEYWVIGNIDNGYCKKLIEIASSGMIKREVEIHSIRDIDNLLKISTGLPALIFVTKPISSLNYCEQVLLEIAEKYDINIRNLCHPQLLFDNSTASKGNYEHEFFPAWEKFIFNVFKTSFSHEF